jgi:formate/nitrite transporter FocA (FNT family)
MACAWWERKVSLAACLRVWAVSWVGNFAGAAVFVGLMVASGAFDGKDAFTLLLAAKKTHHGFGKCLVLGIFCNWLVCLATWMSVAAQDLVGKFVAVWLPISAFVMVRGEGC